MQPILLKPLFHRGQEQIGIFFSKNNDLNLTVRKIKGVKWTQTHKCWYLPLSESSYEVIVEALRSKANLDETLLKAYWNKKRQYNQRQLQPNKKNQIKQLQLHLHGS